MYRCDIRPCSIEFLALQGTTPGLDWGCLLPVMREVQGFDQHGQHSRRGGEWCRGQARDQKVSKGLLRQHGILLGFSTNRHQKVQSCLFLSSLSKGLGGCFKAGSLANAYLDADAPLILMQQLKST